MAVVKTHRTAKALSDAAQARYRSLAWVGMPPDATMILVGLLEAWDRGNQARNELDRWAENHNGETTYVAANKDLKHHPAQIVETKCRADVRNGLRHLAEIRDAKPEELEDEFADIRNRRQDRVATMRMDAEV